MAIFSWRDDLSEFSSLNGSQSEIARIYIRGDPIFHFLIIIQTRNLNKIIIILKSKEKTAYLPRGAIWYLNLFKYFPMLCSVENIKF